MMFRLVQWAVISVAAVTSLGTLPEQTTAQELQQRMAVLGSPTAIVNTAAGATVNAECVDYPRRIPGRNKDGKLLPKPDTLSLSAQNQPPRGA